LAVAPSFILTKKGLLSVLVIRQAPISAADAAEAKARSPAVAAAKTVVLRSLLCITLFLPVSTASCPAFEISCDFLPKIRFQKTTWLQRCQ
jgi:hypothetical protein